MKNNIDKTKIKAILVQSKNTFHAFFGSFRFQKT